MQSKRCAPVVVGTVEPRCSILLNLSTLSSPSGNPVVPNSGARKTVLAAILLLAVALAHLCWGSTSFLSPLRVIQEIYGDGSMAGILLNLRLPRVSVCLLSGAILGISGLAFQAVFRNPIAEPYVLGVSSGAAIGGSLAAVFGFFTSFSSLGGPLTAGLFGLLTLPFALALGRSKVGYSTSHLLIGGVVLGTMLASVNTLVMLLGGLDTNHVLRWLLGSAANATWPQTLLLLASLSISTAVLWPQVRSLNVIAVSEQQAKILGIQPEKVALKSLAAGTLGTALVVGCLGIIGFIGLVAPHISRKIWGFNLRKSFLGTALVGSSLLVAADIISQRLSEIPVGAVTALLGAPVLLMLLKRRIQF